MENLTKISPATTASLFQTHERPSDLRAAAEQFEALFIQQLLKQARSAKLADDVFANEASETYLGMLDQERATQLAKTMDLGIAEALIGQFSGNSKTISNE
jgi:flagellar protein FlgJ